MASQPKQSVSERKTEKALAKDGGAQVYNRILATSRKHPQLDGEDDDAYSARLSALHEQWFEDSYAAAVAPYVVATGPPPVGIKGWLEANYPALAEVRPDPNAITYYEGTTGKVEHFDVYIGSEEPSYQFHRPIGVNTTGPKGWMASAGNNLEGLMSAGKAGIRSSSAPPWQQVVEAATGYGILQTVDGTVFYRGGANRSEALGRAEAAAKAQHKTNVLPQQALLDAWIKAPKGRDAKPGKRPTVTAMDPSAYLTFLTDTERNAEEQIKVITNHLKKLMPKPQYTAADITTVIPGMESQRPVPKLFNKSKDQAIGEIRKLFFLAATAPPEIQLPVGQVPASGQFPDANAPYQAH